MRRFNLCLIGFGNVGKSFVRLLQAKQGTLRDDFRIDFCITGIATRTLGWIANPSGVDVKGLLRGDQSSCRRIVSANIREWLRNAQGDVLFETTPLNARTGEPAADHLRAALECGAHAISANKGPIVHAYRELAELAKSKGKCFLFESTVMDGVPVFSMFRDNLPAVELRGFRGVLNSTTNVILGEMENGLSFEQAIKKAQELGVAETDPSDDIDGWDAAVKVVALANVLMNANLKVDYVQREGIRGLRGEIVREARQVGKPYKLVCRAERKGERVVASVRPEQVPVNDPLASVQGTSSIISFETDVFPVLSIIEHDPGLEATAYGLLADFVRAVRS